MALVRLVVAAVVGLILAVVVADCLWLLFVVVSSHFRFYQSFFFCLN